MKKILVVSHCILNTAAKVRQDERALCEENALRGRLLRLALEQDIQLLQLPCPELQLYGSRRWGHVREQFDQPFYRAFAAEILEPVLRQLREYASDPARFAILGIVSVEGSPSCGCHLTCSADWGGEIGERLDAGLMPAEMAEKPGVFMEILIEALAEAGLSISVLTMDEAAGVLQEMQKEV